MTWVEQFEGLKHLDATVLETLVDCSEVTKIEAHTVVFGLGKTPEHLVLLLEGSIQVQQISDSGREIVLYRVNAGDSCVLTAACVLAYEDYSVMATAETDITAVMIPRQTFENLLGESKQFRHFVLSAFTKRLADMFQVVDEIAFKRIDHRLAQKLIELSSDESQIKATHQNLASELGSVREVVSRQMAEFQTRGWILQHRGMIEIVNRDELVKLIES